MVLTLVPPLAENVRQDMADGKLDRVRDLRALREQVQQWPCLCTWFPPLWLVWALSSTRVLIRASNPFIAAITPF